MAGRAAQLKVHVADVAQVRRVLDAVERMKLHEHAGGDSWWAAWEDLKEALAALNKQDPPARSTVSNADQDLAVAVRRYEVAEAALTALHAFVAHQLDPGYDGTWNGYHTDPDAVRLADRLQRAHESKAGGR